LVAVSGGPDSVALLHLLYTLRDPLKWERITVAHFDHQIRGAESREEKECVESLALKLNLPYLWGGEDVVRFGKRHSISLEMAARQCRHHFFQRTAKEQKAHKIALGHTANDQAEELLLRLFRGTGPGGLRGMPPLDPRNHIVRPLLFAQRPEIVSYLQEYSLPFRQDSSNEDPFCQRNALRLKVFPILEEHFHPRIVQVLNQHARRAQEEEDFWTEEIKIRWSSICIKHSHNSLALNLPLLAALHPALQRRLFRWAILEFKGTLSGIYAANIENIHRLAHESTSGKTIHLPHGLQVSKEGESLVLSRAPLSPPRPFQWTLPSPGRYHFSGLDIHLRLERRNVHEKPLFSSESARIDAHRLQWPLILRSWKPGDRFRPMGLHGSKKIQDLFVDAKIPSSRRDKIPILCDQENICWVVGLRLDERVKVTSETEQVLVVEVHDQRIGE
jgi:tRNA(Ile)-lysidine synthase